MLFTVSLPQAGGRAPVAIPDEGEGEGHEGEAATDRLISSEGLHAPGICRPRIDMGLLSPSLSA